MATIKDRRIKAELASSILRTFGLDLFDSEGYLQEARLDELVRKVQAAVGEDELRRRPTNVSEALNLHKTPCENPGVCRGCL